MGLEQKVNTILQKYPGIKKAVKRTYQVAMYSISSKTKAEGDINRLTPKDGYEYFFGYYDKSPWNAGEEYILSLRVEDTTKAAAPEQPADIVLIDSKTKEVKEIAETSTWNVQQGAMLQWLGPDHTDTILFNDFRNNAYVSVALNIDTMEERVFQRPVYSVSEDGKTALSLDFSRLHRLRPGYGYSNKADQTQGEKVPDQTAIWKLDLMKNESVPLLKYTDLYNFEHRSEMDDADHKVNHIMINPSSTRFMFLHRWMNGTRKFSRLITCDMDGTDMYNLSDDNMVSHCNWKNDEEIIGFARKEAHGNGYFLMKDKTETFTQLWPSLTMDGHPSYSPEGNKVVTDTYPDRARIQKVFVLEENATHIDPDAKVFAPFKYDNDYRCDLHPRWNRKGDRISFDATFEGKRALYELNI